MEKSRKIVLFDIDYTLFDTDAYRHILYPRLAEQLGLSVEELRVFRNEFEPEMKAVFGHFNPEFFLEKISVLAKNTISPKVLEEIFWDKTLYSTILNKKSREVLARLKNNGVAIGLLSTGDRKHQLAKVEILLEYFPEEHHNIFSNKLELISEVLEKYSQYKVYIVDDLPEVLATAKGINKEVITILKRTTKVFEITKKVDNFMPDWSIDDISEIGDIVLNN